MTPEQNNDGGTAFPLTFEITPNSRMPDGTLTGPNEKTSHIHTGMSLRDWFAGQALAGILAGHVTGSFDAENTSLVAYEIADAMLKARAAP